MPIKSKAVSKKGEATRLAIEDAAMELFIKNGYHATSMRQIAEHAGLALGGVTRPDQSQRVHLLRSI